MSQNLESEIALIKHELQNLNKYIEADRKTWHEHVETATNFRERVITIEERVKGHTTEHTYYRWLFGIIITIGLAILGKLYL